MDPEISSGAASRSSFMARRITKAEARAFRERWQRVNAREEEELRSTSLEVRWQQFNTLLCWAHQFGWTEALREGEEEVRERWVRLRKAYLSKKRRSRGP
jgi:hypothetical protein